MHITPAQRKQFSIASTEEELMRFARTVRLGDKIGFPILLVPFGGNETDEIIVPDEDTLMRIGADILKRGIFEYVHVLKSHLLRKP